eukprot:scaffold19271_cov28-Tisochrysis_lutea.AAC.8
MKIWFARKLHCTRGSRHRRLGRRGRRKRPRGGRRRIDDERAVACAKGCDRDDGAERPRRGGLVFL